MHYRTPLALVALGLCLGMSACGGGEDGPSPEPTPSNANHCFDAQLLATEGSTWKLSTANDNISPNVEYVFEVTQNTTFDTHTGLTRINQVGSSSGKPFDATSTYVKVHSAGVTTLFGSRSFAYGGTGATTVTHYMPPVEDTRGNLKLGETWSTTLTGTEDYSDYHTNVTGTTVPFSRKQSVKYVGDETIEIPAGRFPACIFVGEQSTQWVWRGIVIQQALTQTKQVFERATALNINGQPAKP